MTYKNKNAIIIKYLATDKIIKITRELVIRTHNKIAQKKDITSFLFCLNKKIKKYQKKYWQTKQGIV